MQQGRSSGCIIAALMMLAVLGGIGLFVYFVVMPGDDSRTTDRARDLIRERETEAYQRIQQATLRAVQNSDVTPTIDFSPDLGFTPLDKRRIIFPNANTAGEIVSVSRVPGGWDVSNLQKLVGHLEGTAWLDQSGNIVLAGHFEDEVGEPGPFRYLYFAEVGDLILVQDGEDTEYVFEVRDVFRTEPDDLEVLRSTPEKRLTLITCDSWDPNRESYQERLVVIAYPVNTPSDSTTQIN
jgi:LPXTG-site transpeptidase (sortase) family protein